MSDRSAALNLSHADTLMVLLAAMKIHHDSMKVDGHVFGNDSNDNCNCLRNKGHRQQDKRA